MESIHIPSGWRSLDDLMAWEAGRAYVLRQLDRHSSAVQPDHEFHSSRTSGDPSCYWVYSDGSLWFVNNAEDDVWGYYRDFIENTLLDGLRFRKGLCWNGHEYQASDYFADPWLIDDMDRQLLLLYCDGDDGAARALVCKHRTATHGD